MCKPTAKSVSYQNNAGPELVKNSDTTGIDEASNSPPRNKVRVAIFTVVGSVAVNTALKVIESRDDLEVACVITCSGPRSKRSEQHIGVAQALYPIDPNIDIIMSNKKTKYATLMEAYEVDLVLTCVFPWLLPPSLTSNPNIRYGCINLHPSDLPKYRGPNPLGWAIVNGDDSICVTVHRMDGSFDTGPILAQTSFHVGVNDGIFDIMRNGEEAFQFAIDKAITRTIKEDPGDSQEDKEASEAPCFCPEFRLLDFEETSLNVHNKVRAWSRQPGYTPGALASIEGKTVRIVKTFYCDDDERSNPQSNSSDLPGTVVARNEESGDFQVQCGDGCLTVLEWYEE